MQVTEAVRDATVSGRKVKKGQTIVARPGRRPARVDNDSQKAVMTGLGRLEPGFGLLTIYYGEDRDAGRGGDPRAADARARPRGRRRGRSTAASRTTGTSSPPSERRRRSPAMSEVQGRRAAPARGSRALKPERRPRRARRPSSELLASPVGLSGIQQVAGASGEWGAAGWASTRSGTSCSTCPAGTTTCASCGPSADARDARRRRGGLGARSAWIDISVQQTVAAARGRSATARLTDGHRLRGRDLVRAALHRAPRQGRRRAPGSRARSSTATGT